MLTRLFLLFLAVALSLSATPAVAQPVPGSSNIDPQAITSRIATEMNIPGFNKPSAPRPLKGVGPSREFYTTVAGYNRRYLVNLPRNYNPQRAYPVLIGYGGRKHTPERFRAFSRFAQTRAGDDAIRIYPQAVNNAWEGAPYATVRAGADVAFAQRMVEEVSRNYRIDRSRVYAAGLSNGGGMAILLACKLPHVFAGVVAVSGTYYLPTHQRCASGSVAVKIMHGTLDPFRMEGGIMHGVPLRPIRQITGNYISRNGCTPQPRAERMRNGTRYRYNCSRAPLQTVFVHEGHRWDLTPAVYDEVWEFLARA